MSLYRPQKSPHWHYDFQINGVRFHGSTGTPDRRSALSIEAKKRVEAAEGSALSKRKRMTLTEATGRYWAEVTDGQATADTRDYQFVRLNEIIGKATLLSHIDGDVVSTFIARRRADIGDSSVNQEVRLLRSVMRRARDVWGIEIAAMPKWSGLFLPEPEERVRELSADEERRLFAVLRPDFHALVRFCLLTGIRKSNAALLRWDQIDFGEGAIRLRTKSKRPGGDNHVVPLTPTLRAILQGEKGRHARQVFTYVCQHGGPGKRTGSRQPFTEDGWARSWRTALKDAGIEDFRFHDIRHTAATRILRSSGNLRVTQKLLGHKNIKTTTRYAHVTMEDVRGAMVAVESRNSPEPVADAANKPLKQKS